jgi:chromosome segregation ATPase
MSVDKKVTPPSVDAVPWLEEEVRQAKALVHKLQQQVEQTTNQAWVLSQGLQKAEDILATMSAQLVTLPQLQDEVRQLKEQVGRLHERLLASQGRMEETVRQQQTAMEREREERGATTRRLDAAEKLTQSYEGRVLAIEEGQRRLRDDTSLLQKRAAELDKGVEEVAGKTARHSETVKRLEQESGRVHAELDALAKQDSALSERLQLLGEQARRTEEQVAVIGADRVVRQEFADAETHRRGEQQRLADRLKGLEQTLGEIRQRAEDQGRALELLETKASTQMERVTLFQQQIRDHRQQVAEFLRKLAQFEERQKRRQLASLEQELKEIKQRDLKLGE